VTWSYSGDPGNSPTDAVRYLVGDTAAKDPLVSNEEIAYQLAENGQDVHWAAADVAEGLAARYAREVSASSDGQTFSGDQLSTHYYELAEALRKRRRRHRRGAGPYVGGISWRERQKADEDDDKIPSAFRSHLHDHPGTPDGPRNTRNDPLRGDS